MKRRMSFNLPRSWILALLCVWAASDSLLHACETRIAPIFRGTGGIVARPANGNSIEVRVAVGGAEEREVLYARSDGLVVQLVRSSLCTSGDGQPAECSLTVRGAEAGAWYWVNGDRNAAVAPFLCSDQLSGALRVPDPGGVDSHRSVSGTGTIFVHHTQGLMGIVPHIPDSQPPSGRVRFVGEVFRDSLSSGGMGPEMVVVPAGSFRMGCSASEARCRGDELPAHEVEIEQPFAVSTHEVTFDDYDACVLAGVCDRRPPDEGFGVGRRPVINLSLQDITVYVRWLVSETGQRYFLLTETQWEYAARAGSTGSYYNDQGEANLCSIANHDDRSVGSPSSNELCSDGFGHETAPTGSFLPNAWGLYDTAGNVWERTTSCWRADYSSPDEGTTCASGEYVVRGGAFSSSAFDVRSARRAAVAGHEVHRTYGFRLGREVGP